MAIWEVIRDADRMQLLAISCSTLGNPVLVYELKLQLSFQMLEQIRTNNEI